MKDESGFINSDRDDVPGSDLSDNLHDFRQLYASSKGFARVFTAKKGGRLYAVKTLRQELSADRMARVALRKEYDAAYPVDSPYVARTFDFISLPGLGDAIVMEYCPGNTLADYISDNKPLTENDIAAIAAGIVKGLDDIHAAGVIHRDIKPSNVVYNQATRSVKIIDFGFADSRQFYLLHQAAGTKGYAPPEVDSDDYEASIRDDFHAAAMTLSALTPLCRQQCRRNVHALADRLLAGQEVDASQVRNFILKGVDRHIHKAVVIVIAVAVAIALAAVLYFVVISGRAVSEGVDDHAMTPVKDSPFNPGKETDGADSVMPAVIDEPRIEKKTVAVVADEGGDTPEEIVSAAGVPVQMAEDEKTPNEYGVSHSEAKYMALFKKSDFDHYVVQTTDNILSEWTVVYHNDSESREAREAARTGYYSLEEVYRIVADKLDARFGEYDHRRAKGLVKERMRLWHEGYRPLGMPR